MFLQVWSVTLIIEKLELIFNVKDRMKTKNPGNHMDYKEFSCIKKDLVKNRSSAQYFVTLVENSR